MEIVCTKQAIKDYEKIKRSSSLKIKADLLLELIEKDPFQNPPSYEKLIGFKNVYSRRINIIHRLVYEVRKDENIVVVIRMWTHYER